MRVNNQISHSREILTKLREYLATLNTRGGYNFDFCDERITFRLTNYQNLAKNDSSPAVLILPVNAAFNMQTNCGYTVGEREEDGWYIHLIGHIHLGNDVDDPDSAVLRIEDLIDDFIKGIVNAGNLGLSYVYGIHPAGKQSLFDWKKSTGEGVLTIRINHEFSAIPDS